MFLGIDQSIIELNFDLICKVVFVFQSMFYLVGRFFRFLYVLFYREFCDDVRIKLGLNFMFYQRVNKVYKRICYVFGNKKLLGLLYIFCRLIRVEICFFKKLCVIGVVFIQ